jgi:hypothetical protein
MPSHGLEDKERRDISLKKGWFATKTDGVNNLYAYDIESQDEISSD